MPQERRRHPRVRVDLPVAFETKAGELFDGRVNDLSVGGAFIVTENSPPVGSKLDLTIQLPGDKPLKVDGVIRWTKPDGVGVQFGLMGVRETYAVGELLAGLEPMPDSRRPPAGD